MPKPRSQSLPSDKKSLSNLMKTILLCSLTVATVILFLFLQMGRAAEPRTFQTYEYATIRWAGREHTHLIRPSGQIEMLAPLLMPIKRQDRVEERTYLMNIALNAVAKEGFELASATPDEIILRRATNR